MSETLRPGSGQALRPSSGQALRPGSGQAPEIGSVFVSNYPPYSFWSEAALPDLETALKKAQGSHEAKARATAYRDKVVPAMNDLRSDIDTLETLLPSSQWPVPSYADMLFKF